MTLPLTPEQELFVTAQVASGRYSSPVEVVEEALRLLDNQEHLRARELASFQEELQRRIDSLDRGEGIPADEVRAHFQQKAAKHRQQAA